MSGEVVQLVTFKTRANEDVVDILERHLERAKAGEIQSIALATHNLDDTVTTVRSMAPNALLLLAAASRLVHYINEGMRTE